MQNNYQFFRYQYPYYNRYNRFNPAFTTPNFNYTNQNNWNSKNETNKANTNEDTSKETKNTINNITETDENIKEETIENKNESENETNDTPNMHRLGPIEYNSERFSIFGFSIAIDDLLILGLILILLFESDCDYALIIVLGLMFFNINLGSLNLSNLF